MLEIRQIFENKTIYKDMLLDANPDWSMVERYIGGDMYVVFVDGVTAAEAIVHTEKGKMPELKNIATSPKFRRRGLGKMLVRHLFKLYEKEYTAMCVGTCSNSRAALAFYRGLGFRYAYTVKGFFTDNYAQPIYENGALCEDMVSLVKNLK